jgi:hypothetical protein
MSIFYERGNGKKTRMNTEVSWMDTYLHSAQPPNPVSGVAAIRMDRVNICSKGSTPSILPAAIALLLYAKQLSLCCLFSQYRQHQVPFGLADRPTHSAREYSITVMWPSLKEFTRKGIWNIVPEKMGNRNNNAKDGSKVASKCNIIAAKESKYNKNPHFRYISWG